MGVRGRAPEAFSVFLGIWSTQSRSPRSGTSENFADRLCVPLVAFDADVADEILDAEGSQAFETAESASVPADNDDFFDRNVGIVSGCCGSPDIPEDASGSPSAITTVFPPGEGEWGTEGPERGDRDTESGGWERASEKSLVTLGRVSAAGGPETSDFAVFSDFLGEVCQLGVSALGARRFAARSSMF